MQRAWQRGGPSIAIVDRWYVYVDDQLRPWSVRLPAWIGEHPDLGFSRVVGPAPDPAPPQLRLRRVALVDGRSGRTWSAPVGHPQAAVLRQRGASVALPYRGGTRLLVCAEAQPETQLRRAQPASRRVGPTSTTRATSPPGERAVPARPA